MYYFKTLLSGKTDTMTITVMTQYALKPGKTYLYDRRLGWSFTVLSETVKVPKSECLPLGLDWLPETV